MSRRFGFIACLLGLATLLSGCGNPLPEIAPVQGVVLVKGKPQSGLLVRFLPDPQRGNDIPINAAGETNEQGRYELRYVYKGEEGMGAPVGWHRVLIEDMAMSRIPQGQPLPPRLIPTDYNSPATTPLLIEVKQGPQAIDLEVAD